MKTFIVEWNPQESSFGLEDFSHAISSMEFGDLPWMFRRRCGIRSGDNFYLVKVGDGLEGIVMKGFFRTQPEAYSGDADGGFRTFLRPTFMIDVRRNENIIRKEMLSSSLPALPWGDGVFLMNSHECDVLSGMWEEYLSGIPEEAFSEGALGKRERPDAILDDALILAAEAVYDRSDQQGNPLVLKALALASSWKSVRYKSLSFLFYASMYGKLDAGEIREKGFPEEYADIISILKRSPEMETEDYIAHLVRHNNLRASKIAIKDMELNHDAWLFAHELDDLVEDLYQSAGIDREF